MTSFRRASSLALALPILGFVITHVASCVSLYDLEDYSSAVTMLCSAVQDCDASFYPKCAAVAEQRLEAASPSERRSFLQIFADEGCLDTCSAAKSCLDLIPICANTSTSCEVEAECCGFWNAGTACSNLGCCRPEGVVCGSDDDCCGGSCVDVGGTKTCGGGQCALLGDPCGDVDCCGDGDMRCSVASGTCVQCEDLGVTCSTSADCCSNYCSNEETGEPLGVCDNPSCGFANGVDCLEDGDCCSDICVPLPRDGFSLCNGERCIPNDYGCEANSDCCSGECRNHFCRSSCEAGAFESCEAPWQCCVGTCELMTQQCCILEGGVCDPFAENACCGADAECVVDAAGEAVGTCQTRAGCQLAQVGDSCILNQDCCSQHCNNQECCQPLGCSEHGVCGTGGPLTSDLACFDNGSGNEQAPDGVLVGAACVEAVCSSPGYAYCCCDGWDDACVGQVKAACGVSCDDTDPFPVGGMN